MDDLLVVSGHGEQMLIEDIGKYFKIKERYIGPPNFYLGGKTRLVNLENGSKSWAFIYSQYVLEALKNVESYLAKKEENLNAKAGAPISNGYRAETKATDELRPVDAA